MFDVIIVSHGRYAEAMLESAEMISGRQEQVKTYGLFPGDSVDEFREKLIESIGESLKQREVLLLSDMQSGSPFNSAVAAMENLSFRHVAGINLPLLLEIFGHRKFKNLESVHKMIFELGPITLVDVNKFLEDI